MTTAQQKTLCACANLFIKTKMGAAMRNTVKVIAIKENNAVEVVPLITDACIGCRNSECTKQGHPFIVHNTQKLPVYPGAIVKISASAVRQALQALLSLCLPLAAAIAGYILTPKICASIEGQACEDRRHPQEQGLQPQERPAGLHQQACISSETLSRPGIVGQSGCSAVG